MARAKRDEKLVNNIIEAVRSGDEDEKKSLYEKNLPEGLTMEHCNKKDNYDIVFSAAATEAIGQVAIDLLSKDSKMENFTETIPMGEKATISVDIQREATYNVAGKTGVTKGNPVVTIDHAFGRKNGLMPAALKAIKEEAAKVL